jgi:hypothetical protein
MPGTRSRRIMSRRTFADQVARLTGGTATVLAFAPFIEADDARTQVAPGDERLTVGPAE